MTSLSSLWARMRERPMLALAVILLLALGLRLINLGGRTLWYDEAFAVLFAETGWDAMVEGTLTEVEGGAADVHPLLYYQALHYWMQVFGQGAVAVRLFSVLLGVLTVGVVYRLTLDWFADRGAALAAALITSLAPFHVQYSQEARMYALLALLLMLVTWAYWRAVHSLDAKNPWRGWGWWLTFGVLAGLAMYVQQLAAMFLLALGLLPLFRRDWRLIVRTGLASLLALLIYFPWLLNLPDQLGKLRQYWVQRPNVLHFWLVLRSFVSVNLDFSSTWWLPTFLLAAVLTILLLYRAFPVLRGNTRRKGVQQVQIAREQADREGLGWALWLAFMPMIFMFIVSYLFQPVFLPRALLPSALPFYIALAWFFTRAAMPRPILAIIAAAWAVVIVFGLVTHYIWDVFPNGPFDDVGEFLVAQASDDVQAGEAVILHGNKITALSTVYYQPDLPQRYVRDIPGSGSDTLAVPTQETLGLLADDCAAVAVQGAPVVWYVAFDRFEDEIDALVDDDPANAAYDTLGWLRANYQESGVTQFNDLDVYRFSAPGPGAGEAVCEGDD